MTLHTINSLTEFTAPTEEPVTITEAKAQLRLEITKDDVLIGSLITAARILVEIFLNRSLVDTTWDMKLDAFPTGPATLNITDEDARTIRPTRSRLSSVTSITYIDEDGNSQTLANTEYLVDTDREPGRIREAFDKTWPDTRAQTNAVTVRFVAGYGAPAKVPENIKIAIRMIVAHLYEDRESMTTLNLKELPVVNALLAASKVPELG